MKKCYPALAMCFFILCAVLCSCNTNVGNPSGSDVSFNPDGGFFGLELPDGIDYGGREVRVLTTAVNDDWSYQISPESNPSFSAEDAGTVVSSEKVFESVWGEDYLDSNNTVMVHIRRIREKLGEKPRAPHYITTVWGVGYKIEKPRSK